LSSTGFCGARAGLSDYFAVEVTAAKMRVSLDTFDTVHLATYVFDAASWRFG
jgi:hypothetical protein